MIYHTYILVIYNILTWYWKIYIWCFPSAGWWSPYQAQRVNPELVPRRCHIYIYTPTKFFLFGDLMFKKSEYTIVFNIKKNKHQFGDLISSICQYIYIIHWLSNNRINQSKQTYLGGWSHEILAGLRKAPGAHPFRRREKLLRRVPQT